MSPQARVRLREQVPAREQELRVLAREQVPTRELRVLAQERVSP
jgi:hypothetical protein